MPWSMQRRIFCEPARRGRIKPALLEYPLEPTSVKIIDVKAVGLQEAEGPYLLQVWQNG